MLNELLKNHTLIVASASPRRQAFLKQMGLDFEIRLKEVQEVYPPSLKGGEISEYLAQLKAAAFQGDLKEGDILLTSDTVVWHKGASLAKPSDAAEAHNMLTRLSNDWHEVITSVCFTTVAKQKTFSSITHVRFKPLTEGEIHFYIENYGPYDKAGGYGIQEWIGLIGIEEIKGSHPNVVGLPTHLVHKTLMDMVG
tara:strand:- start:42426 stop:43013 length:588 start_codon:yes stop_codon:yes gene_type:complete